MADNRIDEINYLIKKFMELKETTDECKKMRYFWNLRFFNLSMAIWTDQMKCQELKKSEINRRITTSMLMELVRFKKRKLKNLTEKRKSDFLKQCGELHRKGSKYADIFSRAQTKYSSESLLKDIERYQEEYKKIQDELPTLRNKLTSLEIQCGLNNPYKEAEEILKMNTVLMSLTEDEDNKLSKIMSMLNELEKLIKEIKQKKKILNSIQRKKFIIKRQNVLKYKN